MTMDAVEASSSKVPETRNGVPFNENPTKKKPPGEVDPREYEDDYNEEVKMEEEELTFGNATKYTVKQRNALFQKGLEFERKDKPDQALKCYLECMKGLKNKTLFSLLPECLKNIADIYHAKGDYEKAIQFAQAEKLFYETALIETKEIQKKIEEMAGEGMSDSQASKDLNDLNIEALRADEYEHLARLCLDNNQPQLALEYAGKCAKIRQDVYGSNHVKTRETLDLFASIYAEVGKEQYSDSIKEMVDLLDSDSTSDGIPSVPEVVISDSMSEEPVSILRQRSITNQMSGGDSPTEKKQVRFHESVDDTIRQKRKEEMVSLTITLVLLGICFLVLAALGLWLYCSMDHVQSCPGLVTQLKAWAMTLRYKMHQLTSSFSSSSSSSGGGAPNKMEYSR